MFAWNEVRKYGTEPTDANQLDYYCKTSSSEMHEMHECLTNNGVRTSELGTGFSLWTAQGFVDLLVNDWIKVSITAD